MTESSTSSSYTRLHRLGTLLFYSAFFIYGIGTGVSSTSLTLAYPDLAGAITFATQVVALALLFLKALLQNYRVGRLFLAFAAIALAFVVAQASNDYSFVWLAVFVLSGEGVMFKSVAKVALAFNAIIVLAAGFLSFAGVIPNMEFIRDGVLRGAMGFLQPNNFGSRMLQICLALYVIRYQRYTAWDYVFVAACAAATWQLCNSRTSVYMMLALALVAMPLASHCARVERPRRWIAACLIVFVGAFAFSIYFMVSYSSANWLHTILNDVLSDRLYLMHYYYEVYPPSMLGQYLAEAYTDRVLYSVTGLILDNAYARLVEVHGFALTAAFVLLCISVYLRAYREGYLSSLIVVFTVFAVVGVAEAAMLSVVSNYSLLALSALLFDRTLSDFAGEQQRHIDKRSQVAFGGPRLQIGHIDDYAKGV